LGEDQESVRCIDCFFGPPQSEYDGFVFYGTAVFIGRNEKVAFGQTGDVLGEAWPSKKLWFEPHGEQSDSLKIVRVEVTESELAHRVGFVPTRYSRRTELNYD
jgi:hypothetical protein